MDAKHWHQRWENNEIGFHEGDVNRYLDHYFTNLNLQQGDTVFVPLCGKKFKASQGFQLAISKMKNLPQKVTKRLLTATYWWNMRGSFLYRF